MATKQKFFLGGKVCFLKLEKIAKEQGTKPWVNAVNTAGETALHIAARYNNLELFKLMFPFYTHIEATDNTGNTVLHVLADHHVEKCVKYRKERVKLILALISKGADVNKPNNFGWTLVNFAAKHCHIELLTNLRKIPADLDLRTMTDGIPLLLACKYMFKMKSTSKETKTLHFFLNHDSDINTTYEEGFSALHYAAERYSSKTVKELLKYGADVHLRTKQHKLTPLHLAAKNEHNLAVVHILLKAGAFVESLEIEELTPLQISVLRGSSDVVEYLIKNGANVNHTEKNFQFSPLHMVVYQKRRDLFQLLIDKGADVNGSSKDCLTPLHLALMLGCPQFTGALIFHGTKVNCLYNNRLNPLHVASLMSHVQDDGSLWGTRAIKHSKEKSLIVKMLTYPHNPPSQDYEDVIRLLLRSGADVNALTSAGWTSLHFATKSVWQTDDFVKILLEYGANVDHREPGSGFTALHLAAKNNYDTKVEVLIKAGADVNTVTKDGKSPIHLALQPNCTAVLKLLLKYGAMVDCNKTGSPYTPLHVALKKKYTDAATVLIVAGADVNHLTPEGKSPLHLALETDSMVDLKPLVRYGADVNYKEPSLQLTPLNMALSTFYLSSAAILIDAGADVNSLTQDGRSPLHLALEPALVRLQVFDRILMKVLRLLVNGGADVNYMKPHLQSNPLHIVLNASNSGVAEILINAGADVNALNEDGKRPIHFASSSNDRVILESLIERGADVDCKEVRSQLTPLHLALLENHKEAATILIGAGADVNVLTPDGKSPMHLALESDCKQVLNFLIKRGAKLNCKRRRCLYSLLYLTAQRNDEDIIDQLDDSDKMPLLAAIDHEENREIKKAIFRLSSLVDARNERCCMPVHPDVNNCCNENSACLDTNSVDTHNFQAHNQFISYRILSGAFYKFKNCSGASLEFSNYLPVLNYECMLNAVNLSLAGSYETIRLNWTEEVLYCDEECLEEVEKLKNYSISNNMTLYDVLQIRPRRRRFYTKNLDIFKIKSEFRIYDKLVLAYHYEDKIKAILMETLQLAFRQLTNVHFPIPLIEDIFLDMSIIDVIATIEAAEGFY